MSVNKLVEQQNAYPAELSKLDGCYVLKTDLTSERADGPTVHDRYKDLAQVEWAFRTSKTTHLECRPIHVRPATRTRGHVLVVMLAYRIVAELRRRWQALDVTVKEGLDQLASLCSVTMIAGDRPACQSIPKPRPKIQRLLAAANVTLPKALPNRGIRVTTKKKPAFRRKPS